MKRVTAVVCFVSCFLACATAGCKEDAAGQAVVVKVAESEKTVDFGRLEAGTILTQRFELKNDTPSPVAITDTSVSCSCTQVKVSEETIAAGKSVFIDMTVNTTGYNGPIHQFAYIHLDMLDNPVIKLIIKAEALKK
jgi:hypothetical protein